MAHAASAGTATISLAVSEPDGIDRENWPLTFGTPWPRGVLHDDRVSIHEDGQALPVQTHILSRWPDGSVRWLLADTQITLAARQTKRITVTQAGGPVASLPQALQVDERDDRIDIDTGALRFSVPKSRFAVAERLQLRGGKETGPVTAVLQRENTPLLARPPRSVRILERGPLRVRIELAGPYDEGFDYVVRVEAYAGQALLRVLHTFINRDPADSVRVPRISIDWPLITSPQAGYTAGVEDGAALSGTLQAGVRFIQVDNETLRVDDEERAGKLAGWFSLTAGEQAAGLSVRWFWEQYPQSVALSPDRITYNLWPTEAAPAAVGMGAAKTHEVVLWLGTAAKGAALSAAHPLVASVDSTWIARSGALPQAISADLYNENFLKEFRRAFDRYMQRNASERWDDRGTVHCDEGMFAERARIGAYGMWNWGDWNFPRYHDQTKGCDAWGNLEYDTTQVLALGFAATGDPQMFEAMTVAARHFMDVDTVHFQRRHPEWVGMNHPKNPLHFSFELGGIDLGHTWTEGMLSYYYLTGDERGLAAARGIADYLVRRGRGILSLANPRQVGWPQIALIAVYEATNERQYLESAEVYARRAMELYKAEKVNHWKGGVLADSLAYTHATTNDPAIGHWLHTYARVIGGKRQAEPRFIPALAYVASRTKDPQLRAFALAGVQHVDLGGWGKPFTLGGRLGFRVYSLLAEAGEAPPAPTSPTPHTVKKRPPHKAPRAHKKKS